MTSDAHDLSIWKHLWYFCAGAASVLVITSINEFPSLADYEVTAIGWFYNPLNSGWIWALIALEAFCFGSGISLLVLSHRHRRLEQCRINLAFGFYLLCCIGSVALVVRLNGEIPTFLLWVAIFVLAAIGALYWLFRHRIDLREELFP